MVITTSGVLIPVRFALARVGSRPGRPRLTGGIASAFTADLSRPDEIPDLISAINARYGHIDVVQYGPIAKDPFPPAAELDPSLIRPCIDLYLNTPMTIVRSVLPDMLRRRDGTTRVTQGRTQRHRYGRRHGSHDALPFGLSRPAHREDL
ncbi:SDR family NAD(P)-dependent oxidoreductase [Microbispora sp. NPDC049125]|uniref:SDR family NAD(P)-dependent oxidoreductase n=1 Tax=Microbispora sp. NPDC049125 TaxID=3154929 RepID=UPI00346703DA